MVTNRRSISNRREIYEEYVEQQGNNRSSRWIKTEVAAVEGEKQEE